MSESIFVECPCCGEPVELVIDTGDADHQEYVEDCPVCCRPWFVSVARDSDDEWGASLRPSEE